MHSQNEHMLGDASTKDPQVCLANTESEVSECARKCIVPLSPRLLQPIKRLAKSLHCSLVAVVTRRWIHIDFFIVIQFAVEIHTIEIEAFDVPVEAHGDGENGSETG